MPLKIIKVNVTKILQSKFVIFSYPSILTYVLGAQKNRLIETVLLSTQTICFGSEKKKIDFLLCTLIWGPASQQ